MTDLCSDRNPANRGMTCSLPAGHASPHAMGDGGTWPSTTPSAESTARHRRPYSAVHEQTIPFARRTRFHADRPCEHHYNSAGICTYCGHRLGSTTDRVPAPGPSRGDQ